MEGTLFTVLEGILWINAYKIAELSYLNNHITFGLSFKQHLECARKRHFCIPRYITKLKSKPQTSQKKKKKKKKKSNFWILKALSSMKD